MHVQTPTLNINTPQFQPNLPHAQNNQTTNYHTHQPQIHTLPTQPFNTRLLQFNPQVPPPYFTHYPPTNSLSLYSKLREEMTGRFNQDLPENLQTAFEKAMNFEPQIITKQSINNRKVHEVNHIDVTQREDEVEINEAHVRNPNYKGKNNDPNYQQNRTKMNTNMITNTTSSHNNTGNQGYSYNKSSQHDKPVNVSVTLHGPVSKEQLYKIQEVLRHPSQYRDRIKPEDRPAKGEYANAFNKFCPKRVEVNKATVEEAIKYGHFLKRSEEDIVEAIDIYKTLGNKTFYGPEDKNPANQQEQPEQ